MTKTTELHTVTGQAKRQGWTVLLATDITKVAGLPSSITLCKVRDNHYAVHFFNAQDGGFHHGEYCDEDRAVLAYRKRVKHYTR